MPEKFTPNGKPLNLKQLEKIAEVTEIDVKRSLNQSNSKLKEYLGAKS